MRTISEAVRAYGNIGANKANLPMGKMVLPGFFAGMFIAVAGAASTVASCAVENASTARLIYAAIFPTGLFLVVSMGTELFTGNSLMVISLCDGKCSAAGMINNWAVVYLSNLLGAVFVAWVMWASGLMELCGGAMGNSIAQAAAAKAALTPVQAFLRGVLCNMLVCISVLLVISADSIPGKAVCIFVPIFVFVICGFEHSVANMFCFPAGMMAQGGGISISDALLNNLLPVTLGNIAGGAVGVGLPCYYMYVKNAG